MEKKTKTEFNVKGIVKKQLFDSKKLEVFRNAVESGIKDEKYLAQLRKAAIKPIFKANFLWKLFKSLFNVDWKIPVLFGMWSTSPLVNNLIPTRGKRKIAELMGGDDTTPVTAVAVGTGTTAAAVGDTALETEITDSGLARGAATVSNQTTTVTGDTEQWIKVFTVTGTKAVTEEGLLDNNTSGGILLARQVFSAINVTSGDTLQITHQIIVS